MRRPEILDVGDDVDMIVRGEFVKDQNDTSLIKAIHALSEVLGRGLIANRYEEIVKVEITHEYIEFRLRYYKLDKRISLRGTKETGYDDVLLMWFLRYALSVVNNARKLETHCFEGINLEDVFSDPYPFDTDPDLPL